MENQAILDELVALLEQTDMTIRIAAMGGRGGGLCKIKDKQVFFVDADAPTHEMAIICARTVRETIDIEHIFIKPQIRDFIEKHGKTG